jgi:hypothetical protein
LTGGEGVGVYHEAGDQNWRLLNKAIPYTTLVRMWVVERLKEELGGKREVRGGENLQATRLS